MLGRSIINKGSLLVMAWPTWSSNSDRKKDKSHCMIHLEVLLGQDTTQHTYAAKIAVGALCVTFSTTFQEICSLPGKTKQQKNDQRWKSLKGCMVLAQKTEATKAKWITLYKTNQLLSPSINRRILVDSLLLFSRDIGYILVKNKTKQKKAGGVWKRVCILFSS